MRAMLRLSLVLCLACPILAQDMGGEGEPNPEEELKRIHELMRAAEDMLINGLEGEQLTDTQKQIVDGLGSQSATIDNLDALIKYLEEQAGQQGGGSSSSSSSSDQSSQGEQSSSSQPRENEQQNTGEGNDPQQGMQEGDDQQLSERERQRLEALRREEILRAEREAAETGARWGLLPPKLKEAILNEKWEEWPLEYQRQIRDFFERINQ